MTKKILAILIIVLGIGGLAFLVYYFFYKGDGSNLTQTQINIKKFFTFNNEQVPITTEQDSSTTTPIVEETVVPRLRKISEFPVSGATFVETKNGSVIRYMDRATGNIFDTETDSLIQERISNTTLPKTQNLSWLSNGNSFIAQYTNNGEDITNFYGILKSDTGTSSIKTLDGSFLNSKMDNISVSPDQSKYFYTLPNLSLGSIGTVSSFDNLKKSQIMDSEVGEWLSSWPRDSFVVLTTRPSYETVGFAYLLDTKTGSQAKIIGGKNGLTVSMSPDGENVLYTESKNDSFVLNVLNKKKGSYTTSPGTLPEKCVWSRKNTGIVFCAIPENLPNGNYPDDWYKGEFFFKDYILKLDLINETATMIENISEENGGLQIDAFNLSLDKNEDYLMFSNKLDYSLWSLRLKQETSKID